MTLEGFDGCDRPLPASRRWWVPSTRGTMLLGIGVWCATRGLSLLAVTDPPPSVLRAYGPSVPIAAVIALWCSAAAACLVSLWMRRWRYAMAGVVALHVGWAASAAFSFIFAEFERGWVTAAEYLVIALLIGGVATMKDPPRVAALRKKR